MNRVANCTFYCVLSLASLLFAQNAARAYEESERSTLNDTQPVAVVFTEDAGEFSPATTAFHITDFQEQPSPSELLTAPNRPDTSPAIDEDNADLAPLDPPFAPPPRRRQRRFESLASVPNMFGDFFGLGGSIFVMDTAVTSATADLPLAGGSRRFKVAENNKAIPMDRVFFVYNHFQNALTADNLTFNVQPSRRSMAVDRYTVGFEKTILDSQFSVEVRAPVTGQFEFDTTNFAIAGGKSGNIATSLKALLFQSDSFSSVLGVGFDLPTGDDVLGQVNGRGFMINNDAMHISPFAGALASSDDGVYFAHGFMQLDFATRGNEIEIDDFLSDIPNGLSVGRLNEQALLHLDLSAGRWFYRNDCGDHPAGIAGVVELHYTTTLQDSDVIAGAAAAFGDIRFDNPANRVDVLNLTAGIHTQFASGWNLRVGSTLPLRSADNRLFSYELQVSVNKQF